MTQQPIVPFYQAPWLRWLLSLGICAAFIAAVSYYWGWAHIVQPWQSLSWLQLAACLAMLLMTYALRTWRIYDYFSLELRGMWWRCNGLMLIHNALNNVLPARLGEASFPLLMRQYFGLDVARTSASLLWFRLLDLHALLAFGLYAMLIVSPLRRVLPLAMLLYMGFPLLGLYGLSKFKVQLARSSGRWHNLAERLYRGLPQNWRAFWRSWLLTWLNWLIKMLSLAWLMGFFVPQASFNLRASAISAAELTSVLPIHSFGGFGTYESGMIAVLTQVVTMDFAVSAAVNTHLFVLGSSLAAGLCAWLLRPAKFKG